jgi:hypothetical protein
VGARWVEQYEAEGGDERTSSKVELCCGVVRATAAPKAMGGSIRPVSLRQTTSPVHARAGGCFASAQSSPPSGFQNSFGRGLPRLLRDKAPQKSEFRDLSSEEHLH